jgi:transposase-like protein
MQKSIKRQHSAEFKTQVVLELLKQDETMAQICSKFGIHPTQANRWREIAINNLKNSFNGKSIDEQLKTKEILIDELYKQIGHLKVSLDWLKKKLGLPIES